MTRILVEGEPVYDDHRDTFTRAIGLIGYHKNNDYFEVLGKPVSKPEDQYSRVFTIEDGRSFFSDLPTLVSLIEKMTGRTHLEITLYDKLGKLAPKNKDL
jgi:hypothetical protein